MGGVRLVAVAAVAALIAGAPAAQAAKLDHSTKTVKKSLKRLVKLDGGPPGAIAIIQRKGERRRVVKAGFGDLMPTERPHPTDHMRIASVSKAFSGAVALSLVDEAGCCSTRRSGNGCRRRPPPGRRSRSATRFTTRAACPTSAPIPTSSPT